ncbi:hypothetical protein [Chitinophaga sp. sic0106]|uniref:hypothetical protein n=1 Tax=Chitinophaga sp. sic0106 TaxID=2854785 RepID=UPI001C43AFAE|nr:hypothetical protein [Chitinophaga sp. sic0106]MBV7530108.1 hypothetical protein [Chitinophaga sp. sic0106]
MQTHDTLYYKNRSVFNSIAFVIMIAANVLAVKMPINGLTTAEVADRYPSLFAPAGFTFSIWSLIYLGLLAFTVCQQALAFTGSQEEMLRYHMERMKHWFILSCILNAGWLFTWHYQLIPVAQLLMLLLFACLVKIHINFDIYNSSAPRKQKLFVQIPFSIYLGWIAVATLANFAALCAYADWFTSHQAQIKLTVVLIGIAALVSMYMVMYRNNILHALVSVWAFYGIMYKRQTIGLSDEYHIIYACIMGMGLIAITISWHLIRKQKSSV